MIKKSVYFSVFILFIVTVISCEKDFKDIASKVVSNTKFDTKDTIIEVTVTNKQIKRVRTDGLAIGGALGQYLLGVYNNPDYEKIEASIVSQLTLDKTLNTLEKGEKETYGADTTVVTTIDTVFLKIPYQATLKRNSKSKYTLDSIIGDQTKPFNLNIYRTDTYMNKLNPTDPSKKNTYYSDATYQTLPGELNAQVNYQFIPNALDTMLVYKRRLSNGVVYKTDTLKLVKNNPFARIPLNENLIKQLFVDKFKSSNFDSQQALNQYFKGLYLKATGNEGSLISFNIASTTTGLKPAIEIRYTKTVLKGGSRVIDTIPKSSTFLLSNFSTSVYKMEEKVYSNNKNIVIQGTAGNMADIKLFDSNKLPFFRNKKWLINEASLTFYVNQDIVKYDTIATPFKLFLYKNNIKSSSQIKDFLTGGATVYGGKLELSDKKPNKYTFRITDYISDLFSGASKYNPTLRLKVFNTPTDLSKSSVDTLVTNYNWNPKAVTLLNHFPSNGDRRARLKISYSVKK